MGSEQMRKGITLFLNNLAHYPGEESILCFNADGEALISRDLFVNGLEYAALMRSEKKLDHLLFVLVTNGTLLDREILQKFADHRVAVTVSIDGKAGSHDRHRLGIHGQSSFDKVMEGIGLLRESGIPVSFRSVISPETLPFIAETFMFLYSLGPARPIKLRPVRMDGPEPFPPWWVKEFTRGFIECLEYLFTIQFPPDNFPDDAIQFFRFLGEKRGRREYCGAGDSMLWLSPDGTFHTCGLYSHMKEIPRTIDSMEGDDNLVRLVREPPFIRLRKENIRAYKRCSRCRWEGVCGGGCPALPLLSASPSKHPLCDFYSRLGEYMEKRLFPGNQKG